MSRLANWLCPMLVVLASLAGHAAETGALDVGRIGDQPITLTAHFFTLEDPSGELTIDQVSHADARARFVPSTGRGKALNLGFTTSAYWLRLDLANTDSRPVETMIETTVARFAASVDFHQPADGGGEGWVSRHTGYLEPFSGRAYPHHFYVFPVRLPANSAQSVYLRLHSPTALNVPARIWQRDAFHHHERADYATQALYYGMVLAMVAFNLLLFLVLRDRSYLLYVLFISSSALAIAANNGMAIEYLVGEWPVLANASTLVLASITLIFFLLFLRRMVPTRQLVPRLDFVLRLLLGLHCVLPVALLVAFPQALKPALMTDGATAVMILMTGLVCAFKRDRSALFFIAAFAALCLSGLASSLSGLGIIPVNAVTDNGLQFGSALEMIVLAFALADRYNVLRRERARARHEALAAQTEALLAEQRAAETLRQSELLLGYRVKASTAELASTIDKLRQTQAEIVQAEKLASLGALVAGVAHELNTPIGNALVTSTSLEAAARESRSAMERGELRRSALKEFFDGARSMAELIVRSCQRASTLITSFKQVAVDQSSEQRRTFNLLALVTDNIAALRPSYKDVLCEIAVEISPDLALDSFPGPLGQTVAILVGNALTHAFGNRSDGRIVIVGRRLGDGVELRIEDNGSGMTPEVLGHVFDPFFTTRLGQGNSGLGLSIARNIVTGQLGGTLHAAAESGRGSCFTLRIPLVAPDRSEAPPIHQSEFTVETT